MPGDALSSLLPFHNTTMASGGPTSLAWPPAPPIIPITPRFHRHNIDGLSELAKDQHQRFAHDIEWTVVGPMLVDHFLEKSLLCRLRVPNLQDVTFSEVPNEPGNESAIYPRW